MLMVGVGERDLKLFTGNDTIFAGGIENVETNFSVHFCLSLSDIIVFLDYNTNTIYSILYSTVSKSMRNLLEIV